MGIKEYNDQKKNKIIMGKKKKRFHLLLKQAKVQGYSSNPIAG